MNESKIVAAKRLQSEGLWNEASLYREEVREHLRDEGMTRKEANRGAWGEKFAIPSRERSLKYLSPAQLAAAQEQAKVRLKQIEERQQ